MKRKKKDYLKEPWTPFVEYPVGDTGPFGGPEHAPHARAANSRYDVGVWHMEDPALGKYVHLSIKDHGRSARHDWRDLQRIKNELVGPEYEAIEIYPAERRRVDSANQWHIFVFEKSPVAAIGFHTRLVTDGVSKYAPKAEQRPFEERPADCLTGAQFDALYEQTKAEREQSSPLTAARELAEDVARECQAADCANGFNDDHGGLCPRCGGTGVEPSA